MAAVPWPAGRAAGPRGKPLLQVRGVTKEYRTEGTVTHALRGVDLEVAPGEYLAVMGPSGSGKSTLLHIMAGLDRPTSGAVRIGGRDISTLPDRRMTLMRRRELGFVFQFFNLVPCWRRARTSLSHSSWTECTGASTGTESRSSSGPSA